MRPEPMSLDDAIASIESGEIDAVTCDVFDTLVWRPTQRPSDLFVELGRRLAADDHLGTDATTQMVVGDRVHAEMRARGDAIARFGEAECTLDEAWAHSGLVTSGALSVAELVDQELDVERAHLRAHDTGRRLIDAARRADVPVALVSDTYLSVDELSDLLTDVGIELDGVEVITSSSRRRHKFGGLLADVIDELEAAIGIDRGRVLHVGDHPLADLDTATRVGLRTCHVDLHPDDDVLSTTRTGWRRLSGAMGSDGGHGAVVRETYVGAGEVARQPGYQFGVEIAGPIMAGFADWAGMTAESLGASAIHCLLREGARIAELIDIVRPTSPRRVPVHASRWAVLRCLVDTGSLDELASVFDRRGPFHARLVANAFGVDERLVADVVGRRDIVGDARFAAWEAMSNHDELRDAIVDASRALRADAVTYLDRTLDLDGGPLVLCDIGWGGRIQEGITTMLRDEGRSCEVHGLYALLSPAGERRVISGNHLHAYIPSPGPDGFTRRAADVAIRNAEFLERVNTPPIGTLVTFGPNGTPITRPDADEAQPPSLVDAQAGVLDYARSWARMVAPDPAVHDPWSEPGVPGAALEALATVITAPDARLAEALAVWEHDDVAGADAEPLADEQAQRWAAFANGPDTAAITMNEQFWLAGAAGGNPALAAQLAAIATGADPDAVAPRSRLGLARLAVFEHGSDLATDQLEEAPRVGPNGWMLLRLTCDVAAPRSVRLDVAQQPVVADIGDLCVTAATNDGRRSVLDGIDATETAQVIDGAPLGRGRFVLDAGGHVLFDLPDIDGVRSIDVDIAVRAWPLDDAQFGAVLPRWRRRAAGAADVGRRAAGQLKRRVPRSST